MKDLWTKFSGYIVTGGLAAAFDIGGFAVLINTGLHPVGAACASFTLAALVNYTLTARFVFKARRSHPGFATFFLAALAGLCINVGATIGALSLGIPAVGAKVAGVAVAFLFNFAMNYTVVFRDWRGRP